MSEELPPLGNELEQLLSGARGELAPAAAKAKARAALGLPPPTGPAAPLPRPPAAPVASAGVTAATVVKGVVVMALVGAAYGLGVQAGERRARDEFAALPPKTITVEVPVPVPAPPPEPVVVAPTPQPPPVEPTVQAKAPRPVLNETDALQAELALLEAARTALGAKDAAGALKAVAKYDASFPRGTMRTDAQLTRLEALLLAGRRAEAEALGKKVSTETDSELVRNRVRRLLDAK